MKTMIYIEMLRHRPLHMDAIYTYPNLVIVACIVTEIFMVKNMHKRFGVSLDSINMLVIRRVIYVSDDRASNNLLVALCVSDDRAQHFL